MSKRHRYCQYKESFELIEFMIVRVFSLSKPPGDRGHKKKMTRADL